MAATPNRFRRRITLPWTTLVHVAGGVSPHSASASESVLIGSPALTTRADSTTRSLGLSPFGWPPTCSGPSTAIPMLRLSTSSRYPSTGPLPSRHRSGAGPTPPGRTRGLSNLHEAEEPTMIRHPSARGPATVAALAALLVACGTDENSATR